MENGILHSEGSYEEYDYKKHALKDDFFYLDLLVQKHGIEKHNPKHRHKDKVKDFVAEGPVIDINRGIGHFLKLEILFLGNRESLSDDFFTLLDCDRITQILWQRL